MRCEPAKNMTWGRRGEQTNRSFERRALQIINYNCAASRRRQRRRRRGLAWCSQRMPNRQLTISGSGSSITAQHVVCLICFYSLCPFSLSLSLCITLLWFFLFLAHCALLWVPSLFALMKGLQAKLINGHSHTLAATHTHTHFGTHSARCLLLTWPRHGMPSPLNSSCCTRFAMDHNCDRSWSWSCS